MLVKPFGSNLPIVSHEIASPQSWSSTASADGDLRYTAPYGRALPFCQATGCGRRRTIGGRNFHGMAFLVNGQIPNCIFASDHYQFSDVAHCNAKPDMSGTGARFSKAPAAGSSCRASGKSGAECHAAQQAAGLHRPGPGAPMSAPLRCPVAERL